MWALTSSLNVPALKAQPFDVTKLARVGGTICMTGVHKAPHAV